MPETKESRELRPPESGTEQDHPDAQEGTYTLLFREELFVEVLHEQPDYLHDDVVLQSLVAFGQGTNYMRVSSRACRALHAFMSDMCYTRRLNSEWGTIAVQLLERIRLVGRLSAQSAIDDGRTVVMAKDVIPALRKARLGSKTETCDEPARYP